MPRGRPKKNKEPEILGLPEDDAALDLGFVAAHQEVGPDEIEKLKALKEKPEENKALIRIGEHGKRDHASLSASGSHIWMACPGSLYLQSKCPTPETSVHAEEGTKAHEMAEKILTTWLMDEVEITKAFSQHRSEFPSDEMSDHILEYVLSVARLLAQREPLRIAVEKRFILNAEREMFGTADFAFTYQTKEGYHRGIILDLKYGQGVPVDAERNPQLAYYACAMNKTPEWGPLEGVEVFIFQPRCEHEAGPLRSMKLNKADLAQWENLFEIAAKEASRQMEEKCPAYFAGEHCRWCKAVAVCTAHHADIHGNPAIDFESLADEPESQEVIGALTEEQIVSLVLKRARIESFLQRAEDYVANQLKSGLTVPGLKLVYGRSTRHWVDSESMVVERLSSLGLGDSQMFERSLIGITKAEKIVGKNKLDGITEKSDPSLKVVAESDPREAVRIEAVEGEFEAIE